MSACLPTGNWIFLQPRLRLRRTVARLMTWGGIAALGALSAAQVLGAFTSGNADSTLRRISSESAMERAQVAVSGVTVEREHEFVTVTGEARNASAWSLSQVEVMVELFDGQRNLLRVESALLEAPSLRPGEESPFRVQLADAAGATSYRIRFRHLLGAMIPAR